MQDNLYLSVIKKFCCCFFYYFVVSGQFSVYLMALGDVGFLHYFRSGCCLPFRFLNTSNFFVSELNYQVFLVRIQGTFWYQNYFDLPKLCFVSPVFYILSNARRRHDVHVLFGDVSYDVRNVHWRVNNKIKRILLFFSEYHKNCHLV